MQGPQAETFDLRMDFDGYMFDEHDAREKIREHVLYRLVEGCSNWSRGATRFPSPEIGA